MSQIAPLLDALKKHNAEEIRLEVGDRIYMLQDGQRRNLGREPLQEGTLEHTARGVIGPDGVRSLSKAPQSVSMTHAGENFEVLLHRPNGTIAIRLRRLRAAGEPSPKTNVGTCL